MPGGQFRQFERLEAPVNVDQVPASQLTHPVLDDDAIMVDHVPSLQLMQAADPTFDHVPAEHDKQVDDDDEPAVEDQKPALHLTQTSKDVAPSVDDHVPAGHKVHMERSEAPVTEDQVPRGHWKHSELEVIPRLEDHVPAKQF